MAKVQSQSGTSLADTYDVPGSIAGIEEIRVEEVQVVHDLAQTLTMERMEAEIVTMITAATAQSTAFAVAINPLTASAARLMGITVQVDNTTRLTNVNVCLRDPLGGTEIPLFVWEAGDGEVVIRMDDGVALANQIVLVPHASFNPFPLIAYGIDLKRHVNQYRLRGTTSAFGAGTVVVTAQIYAAFTDAPGALSSRGVPIPSW